MIGGSDPRRNTLVVTFLVLTASWIFAAWPHQAAMNVDEAEPGWADELHDDLQRASGMYNDRVEDLHRLDVWGVDLSYVMDFVAGKTANVYVVDGDGPTATYSLVVDESTRVTDVRRSTRENATVRVVVNRAAVRQIAGEYTQVRAIKESFLSDAIHVEGVGPVNQVKWWFAVQAAKWLVRSGDAPATGMPR